MRKEDCFKGQKVNFGRGNGEQTLGEVVKCNPTKAKVKQLESRGTMRSYPIGTVWTVPYSLMSPVDQNSTPTAQAFPSPVPREKLVYSPFSEDNDLYNALLNVYAGLSPENLSCDGEASAAQVRQRRAVLERKKRGLLIALGREVDEADLYEWEQGRREYDKVRLAGG
jgi:hypothetical protein